MHNSSPHRHFLIVTVFCTLLTACAQSVQRTGALPVSANSPSITNTVSDPTSWPPEPVTLEDLPTGSTATHVRVPGKYPLRRRLERQETNAVGKSVTIQGGEMVADHLLVTLRPGVKPAEVDALATRLGVTLRATIGGSRAYLLSFTLTDAGAFERTQRLLAKQPEIASVEPDWIISINVLPDDPRISEQWGLDNPDDTDVDAPEAWELSTGNPGIRVAVLDTGIDYHHPDLAANIWINPGESGLDAAGNDKRTNGLDDDGNGYIDDWRGWDFYNDDNDPMDDNSHGTHCAGIIAAAANNALGISGIAPKAKLFPIKSLGAYGSAPSSVAIEAIHYATLMHIPILSNSWGGGEYSTAVQDALSETTRQGLLFVAAAGNKGSPFVDYPAAYQNANILSVGATDRSDRIAPFSDRSSGFVDLMAPGADILSTVPGGGYAVKSGTSMATPLVAGAAALLLDRYPQATAEEVIDRLRYSVDKKPALDNSCLSGGRMNVRRALEIPSLEEMLGLSDGISIRNPGPGTWMLQEKQFHSPPGAFYSPVWNYESSAKLELSGVAGSELRFWWKIEEAYRSPSETLSFASLTVLIDGKEVGHSITGTVDWQEVVIPLSASNHRISWIHKQNNGQVIYSNAWIDTIQIVPRESVQPSLAVTVDSVPWTSGQVARANGQGGDIQHLRIGLRNDGSAPLLVQPPVHDRRNAADGALVDAGVSAETVIQPGETAEIPLRFWALTPSWSMNLIIHTNDPKRRIFELPVQGTASGTVELADALDVRGNPFVQILQGEGWVGQRSDTSDGSDAAVADMLGAGQERVITMRVLRPCLLNNRWKIAGGGTDDSLKMTMDFNDTSLLMSMLTGDKNWRALTNDLSYESGWMTLRLTLSRSMSAGNSSTVRGLIDQIEVLSLAKSLAVSRNENVIAADGNDTHVGLVVQNAHQVVYRLRNSGPVPLTFAAPGALTISEAQNAQIRIAPDQPVTIPAAGFFDLPVTIIPTSESWSARVTFKPDFSAVVYPILLTGTARRIALAEALDLGVTGPAITASDGWFGETSMTTDNTDAAAIAPGEPSAEQNLQMTVTGAGQLGFSWRTLGAPGDRLRVAITGAGDPLVRELTTADAWQTETITLAPGPHTITWSFTTGAAGGFAARAWLDAVTFIPDTAPPVLQRMTLRLVGTVSAEVTSIQVDSLSTTPVGGAYDILVPTKLPVGTTATAVPVVFLLRDGSRRTCTIQARIQPTPTAAN